MLRHVLRVRRHVYFSRGINESCVNKAKRDARLYISLSLSLRDAKSLIRAGIDSASEISRCQIYSPLSVHPTLAESLEICVASRLRRRRRLKEEIEKRLFLRLSRAATILNTNGVAHASGRAPASNKLTVQTACIRTYRQIQQQQPVEGGCGNGREEIQGDERGRERGRARRRKRRRTRRRWRRRRYFALVEYVRASHVGAARAAPH